MQRGVMDSIPAGGLIEVLGRAEDKMVYIVYQGKRYLAFESDLMVQEPGSRAEPDSAQGDNRKQG